MVAIVSDLLKNDYLCDKRNYEACLKQAEILTSDKSV